MIIVKSGAVTQNKVALDFVKSECALGVLREIIGFVRILEKLFDAKTPRIAVWILATVIPAHSDSGSGGAANQRDGLGDDVEILGDGPAYPNFGLGPELNV